MSTPRVGLVVAPGQPATVVEAARLADQRGVPMLWSIAPGVAPDPLTLFAAAAVQTERVGLGTAIIPIYPRHPAALASQALAVAALAPGRLRLGIGPGGQGFIERSLGIPYGRPLSRLREYVTVLRGLLWDGKADFDGEVYQVHATLPAGVTPPRVPILISALRPPAYHLAGEVTDGALAWVSPVRYLVDHALPALRAGAQAAGRPTPPLLGHILVALSTDRLAVQAAVRAQFGFYGRLPQYMRMFADAGFPAPGDGTLPDGLVDALAVSGTPTQVEARLREILAQGIDEVMVSHVAVADAAAEGEDLAAVLAGLSG